MPPKLTFEHDQIDIDVIQLVKKEFSQHIGNINSFQWATTRQNALLALDHFISNNLPHFGDYQDAMVYGSDFMFHSLLSPYLNCGLLLPKEVCDAAQTAYYNGQVP